jgi:enoyl-CoA hydratase
MDFSSDVITIEQDGHIATVWLDRPDKLNAMNIPMWDDLPPAMDQVGSDPEVRVVIIAGKGRAFTAGIDIQALAMVGAGMESDSEVAKRQALYRQIKKMQHTITSVADCPKPVIAAVHGYCIGAGVDLITACDIRLASPDATFSVREAKLGMVADVGTMQRLPKVIAPGHVAELAFTGKDITADRAKEIGLINDVYTDVYRAALNLAGRDRLQLTAGRAGRQGCPQSRREPVDRPSPRLHGRLECRFPAIERPAGGHARPHRKTAARFQGRIGTHR